jgi:hypothetical protein
MSDPSPSSPENPWGLRLYRDETESPHNSSVYYSIIAAGPSWVVMNAVATARRNASLGQSLQGLWWKIFGRPAELADDPFEAEICLDLRGWMDENGGAHDDCMDPEPGDRTRDLLGDPGVRAALIEATRVANRVHINHRRVTLCASSSTIGFDPGRDLEGMERAAAELCIALERWARGEPGGPLREGARERKPEEWPSLLERLPGWR